MKPNVLLVVLPYVIKHIDANRPKVRSFFAFPFGLLSIATYCKDLAKIRLCDYGNMEYEEARNRLEAELEFFHPEIVGFSMGYDNSYPCLSELAGIVKNFDSKILVVLGGSAASYSYQEIIEEQGNNIDAVCFGEGEEAFYDLLTRREFKNPWITRGNISTPPTPRFIQDLDTVIDIDYSFVYHAAYEMAEAFSPYARDKRKCFFLMTSRGCPFSCRFCSNAAIHGKTVRYAGVDRIIDHVKSLIANYGMETLIIYDDQLLLDQVRAKELFKRLIPFNLRIECPNGLSVRYIDRELAYLMKAAGMDTVYLAIESGSEYVLKKLIRKPLKLSQVKPAVDALRTAGLFIHGFFVMGIPGETDKHREETKKFIREIDLDWCGFNMATPVRGSKLYDDCIKNGWIKKQKISEITDKEYIINVPGTNPKQIERDVYRMNLEFNFHANRRMRIGDYETAAKCFRQVLQRYKGHLWAKYYLKVCEEAMSK